MEGVLCLVEAPVAKTFRRPKMGLLISRIEDLCGELNSRPYVSASDYQQGYVHMG